jgi:general secretion pathway protein E
MASLRSPAPPPVGGAGARRAVLARLEAAGQLDPSAVARAERIAQRTRQPIEQVLNQLGALSDDALVDAYAAVTGLSIWDPASEPAMAAGLDLPITAEFLRRTRCLPLALTADHFLCAACDPLDPEVLDGLRFATGRTVELRIARPATWRTIADTRPADPQSSAGDLQRLEREIDQISDLGATSAGSRVVASAFEAAINLAASDIHFEPRRHDLRVRLRVDGRMVEHLTVSADVAAAVVSRVKVIANLDVGERRLPQDGRTSFVVGGRPIDVRVATSPTVFGESAVLRILDRSTVRLELPALGVSSMRRSARRTACS